MINVVGNPCISLGEYRKCRTYTESTNCTLCWQVVLFSCSAGRACRVIGFSGGPRGRVELGLSPSPELGHGVVPVGVGRRLRDQVHGLQVRHGGVVALGTEQATLVLTERLEEVVDDARLVLRHCHVGRTLAVEVADGPVQWAPVYLREVRVVVLAAWPPLVLVRTAHVAPVQHNITISATLVLQTVRISCIILCIILKGVSKATLFLQPLQINHIHSNTRNSFTIQLSNYPFFQPQGGKFTGSWTHIFKESTDRVVHQIEGLF